MNSSYPNNVSMTHSEMVHGHAMASSSGAWNIFILVVTLPFCPLKPMKVATSRWNPGGRGHPTFVGGRLLFLGRVWGQVGSKILLFNNRAKKPTFGSARIQAHGFFKARIHRSRFNFSNFYGNLKLNISLREIFIGLGFYCVCIGGVVSHRNCTTYNEVSIRWAIYHKHTWLP